MSYTSDFKGIKLDVQAVGFKPDTNMQERIEKMLERINKFADKIVYATFHLESKEAKTNEPKSLKVVLGIPGPDLIASDSGDNFMVLFKNVEEKLIRQIKDRK